jgi:hypothetical protein
MLTSEHAEVSQAVTDWMKRLAADLCDEEIIKLVRRVGKYLKRNRE